VSKTLQVTARNASFQRWESLLANRTKRHRAGEFLVHGVRPITLAAERGWPVRALLYDRSRPVSGWAGRLLDDAGAQRVAMSPDLLAELGEKDADPPELLAVVGMPADDFARIPVAPDFLGLVLDRPASPGNVGSLLRSADAFGAAGVVVTGHGADPYDPKAVRASTGSLFAVPVVRAESPREVLAWVASIRDRGVPIAVVGTDEHGPLDLARHDLTGPTLILVGNEARGLSAAWREACDALVRIPIGGAASSLNAASAGTVVLYEAARQRRGHTP